MIESEHPDVALLDLQMPELGGLDVVRRVPADALSLVAFVTAFEDSAIEAFELNAIDYLLKPVEADRLQATLDRARPRLQRREPVQQHAAAFANAAATYAVAKRRTYLERIPRDSAAR